MGQADGWDKPQHMISTGALASPPARPTDSGRCMACDYISGATNGYFKCPLHPKRFAALSGFSGASTTIPTAMLTAWGYAADDVEFLATCNEWFRPLSLEEVAAGSTRATYGGYYCVKSHVKDPELMRVFEVKAGMAAAAACRPDGFETTAGHF